jgi:hypothetical protein
MRFIVWVRDLLGLLGDLFRVGMLLVLFGLASARKTTIAYSLGEELDNTHIISSDNFRSRGARE